MALTADLKLGTELIVLAQILKPLKSVMNHSRIGLAYSANNEFLVLVLNFRITNAKTERPTSK